MLNKKEKCGKGCFLKNKRGSLCQNSKKNHFVKKDC
jgi:hypothetical protein